MEGEQLGLWDEPLARLVAPDPVRRESLEERFAAFDRANPQVYRLLARLALQMASLQRRFGIKMLYERLRFEYALRVAGDDQYKLNNDYTSRYARKLLQEYPQLGRWMETRTLRSV